MRRLFSGNRFGILIAVLAVLCAASLCLFGCGKQQEQESETVQPPVSGSEVGVYYFEDADLHEEYLVTLSEGLRFSLAVKDTALNGSYTLSGETLTLTSGDQTLNAMLKDGVVTLTYQNAQMRFLKKQYFTVTFDPVGGSATESATVLNGKTVPVPADPTKDGYVFLGWYSDAAYKTPFAFGGEVVTENTTLYARWAEKTEGQVEYEIRYDLGYDGEMIASDTTVGGKLYLPAVPAARDGYEFVGWWVSSDNRADRLTSRFVAGDSSAATVFTADTTLFAVWQATDASPAPQVSVSASALMWDAIADAQAYLVRITAPDGTVLVDNQRTTTTTYTVSFGLAGSYRIEITAVNAGGTAISDTTVRYFTNRALDRVSGITVTDPAVLVFRGVANAEKYFITVDCGNKEHQHTVFDNGTSLCFSFANCEMQEGGIVFTITAAANGYASSTATFVYEKHLSPVGTLKADKDLLTWSPVDGATSYQVKIGDLVYSVTENEFPLAYLPDGDYTVSVTPAAKGYNPPAPVKLDYRKVTPALPDEMTLIGTLLSWSAVGGAQSYEVHFNGQTFTVDADTTEFDLADAEAFVEGADYTLSIRVIGANASAETETVTVRYNAMPDTLTYGGSVLSWTPVVGATSYDVQINDGAIVTVDNGECRYFVDSFTKAGVNTLRVRFHSGAFTSEWVETTVTAHAVTLDSRGGSSVQVLYKAVGDFIDLPVVTKDGYDFSAWYNVPGGAASNGGKYTDQMFAESGEIVLYAYYTPKSYSIIYNNNGDTSSTDTVSFGRDYQLMVPVSDDINRLFGGWFSAPYGAGIAYTDPEGNSLAPWTSLDDNQTLYAFWVESVLDYNLVGNGYTVSAGDRIALVSSVTIPAEINGVPVISIAGGAFADCTTLVELRIPDTVTDIAADTAFSGCTALKSVEVYSTDAGKASARYSSKDGVLFDSGDSAAPHAPRPVFMPAAKTGSYTVPAGVDMIPRSAFAGSKITKIILPSSVKEIGTEAFANCSELTTVVFEDAGVTEGVAPLTVGDRAFMKCTKLTAVTLPARLSAISLSRFTFKNGTVDTANVTDAFLGCKYLDTILVAKGKNAAFTSEDGVLVTSDGTLLYFPVAKSVESYEFPAGVTKIAAGAFYGSGVGGDLQIPGRIISIGDFAFASCKSVHSVTFLEGLSDVTVGAYAFRDSGVSKITFADGSRVTTLSEGAFYGCGGIGKGYYDTEIKTVTIPATMTSIGDKAFSGCGEFVLVIESGDKTLSLGNAVFEGCTLESLTLSKNVTAGSDFFKGLSVSEIIVDPDNDNFMSIDGVLFTKQAGSDPALPETLLIYPSTKSDEYYTIPDGVKTIAAGAFAGNHTLVEVTVPASVTAIGDRAFAETYLNTVNFAEGGTEDLTIGAGVFQNSGIVRIVFPERAKTLGQYALASTSNLSEIDLGGLVTIEAHALEYCSSYRNTISSVTIPASVKTIGEYAFNGANISELAVAEDSCLETIGAYAFQSTGFRSFHVPATVTEIGAGAFYYNYYLSSLTFAEGEKDLVIGVPTVDEYGNIKNDPVINSRYVSEIHFPGRLTVICENAFTRNYDLTTVTFGKYSDDDGFTESRLTKIGANAFASCGISEITIPASVRNTDEYGIGIDSCAFRFSNLTSLTFAAGGSKDTAPLTIGASAFDGCSGLKVVTLPARLASFTDANGNTVLPIVNGRGAFPYTLTDIHVAGDGESEYISKDGILYNADMTEMVFCPKQKAGEIVIPATVVRIASGAFEDCDYITSVVFEEGSVCREIGSKAFYRCRALVSLVIPNSVTEIDTDAFFNCTSLESLTLPASLESFDPSVIRSCDVLQNLYVGEGSTHFISVDGVLFTADGKTMIYYLPTRNDASYTVPEGTEIIGENAFASNDYLTSVTIPASVTLIDSHAFSDCAVLTDVIFANGGTELLVIGKSAFANTALETIRIPARVASIADYAFNNTKLTSVSFDADSKLGTLGNGVFMRTGLISVNLPTSLRFMGTSVFALCTELTSVTIPEGVVSMGDTTFYSCGNLETVNLPSTLETIGAKTFEECTALRHVNFARDSKIETLPNTTFKGCTALESIELPASLTEITGKDENGSSSIDNIGLFSTCTSLKRVTVAEGSRLTKIGISAFEGSALEKFTVPSSVTTIANRAFAYTKLTSISFPRTVTKIGNYLFQACSELTSIDLGAGVTEIPNSTFANCEKLTSFTIPAGVNTISPTAFFWCYALNEFRVDKANTSFHVRDNVVYNSDWELVIFPLGKTSFEIPKEATALPDDFFTTYSQITDVTVEEGSRTFIAENGVLYTYDRSDILFFSDKVTSYEIPAVLPSAMTQYEFLWILHEAPSLEEITVAEGNEMFHAKFGVLYDADWNLILFPKARTEFRIPVELTVIPNGVAFTKQDEDDWDNDNSYSIFQGTALKYVTFEEGRTEDLRLEDVLWTGTVFGDCENLEEVSLPEHTLNLTDYAFIRCASLRVVNLPSTLTEIGRKVFYDCTALEAINVAPGNPVYQSVDGILFDADMNLVWFPEAKESFTIPASFTYLPSLSDATGLKYVTYEKDADGNEVAGEPLTLDSAAFAGLANLETIELPSRVTGIAASMFSGCSARLVFAPGFDLVKSDDNGVVYTKNDTGWSVLMIPAGLTHYTIPADVTFIPAKIFSGSGLVTLDFEAYTGEGEAPALVFEEGVREGWYDYFGVFNGCSSLTSVSLPARLVSVPKYAFMDCSNLETVTFEEGSSFTVIGEYAFQNCHALTSVEFPESLREIGEYAFYYCDSLTTIALPEGLTTIGGDAFEYCSSLESVYIPASVTSVGAYAFYGTYGTIYVAFSEAEADERCDYGWSGYNATVVYDYTKD